MFNGCSSLIKLNLFSFEETSVMTSYCGYTNTFTNCNYNLKFCMNLKNLVNIPNKINQIYNCPNDCNIINNPNFNFAYNNECYETCPPGTYISTANDYLCTNNCDNYYDYNKTKCLDQMPEGYYLNDSILKTIDKCDVKCKNCSLESISNNNYCITCNDRDNYYPIFTDSIINSSFVNCSNQILEGYYFENYTYIPCYSSCKFCLGKGDIYNNNCTECYKDYILVENNCFHKCDNFYFFDTLKNDYICVEKCPNDSPYLNKDNICINDCDVNQIFNNACKIQKADEKMKDDLMIKIREELLDGNLDTIITDIIEGKKEDLIIKDIDIVYQITSPENQMNNQNEDRANIILGECENILRNNYNMSENESLIIFKIDLYEEGLLIPTVNYEIYNLKTKQKLNLSLCDETKIKIFFPTNADQNNLEKYNPNSDYYNDICYSYSENGIDMTSTDRKNNFGNKNLSLCEFNCKYTGYNSKINKSECECQIKIKLPLISNIVINKDKLFKFRDIKNSTNIKILKCYYIVFTKNGLKFNIGSYILLFIILINIISLIVFLAKGHKYLSFLINSLIKKNMTKVKKKDKKKNRKIRNNINNIINKNKVKIIIKNENYIKKRKMKIIAILQK